MKTLQKQYIDSINLIIEYLKSPVEYLIQLNKEKNLKYQPIIKDEKEIQNILKKVDKKTMLNLDHICKSLDYKNQLLVNEFRLHVSPKNIDTELLFKPINRVGIYIPNRIPSTAYTFLSAANAAGVKEIVLYIAQNENGNIDPLTTYIASRYKAKIWGGPARIGFPTLAFGVNNTDSEKCDLVCGPCGARLNIIKNLSCLMSGCTSDMSAGPSDLTVITDNAKFFQSIFWDLLSQLEHGPNSKSSLICLGDDCWNQWINSSYYQTLKSNDRVTFIKSGSLSEATKTVNEIAPESLEIYITKKRQRFIADLVSNCGVIYLNSSSTLGDYGAIGRGCADPTGGFAKSQSGISPLKFLHYFSLINPKKINRKLLESAKFLAEYEDFKAHRNVIKNILKNNLA